MFKITESHLIAAREPVYSSYLDRQVLPGQPGGIVATVEDNAIGVVMTLGVSRLEGETDWTVDTLWRGSVPVFHNGEGSRCTLLKKVADPAIVAALDAHAESLAVPS